MLAAAFAATAAQSPAHASGFLVARFGGEQGHPTTDHPSAIYYNPAGLALGSGTRIYAEGLFGFRTASYDRPEAAIDNVVADGAMETGTPQSAVAANSGKATLSNLVAAPFVAIVSDLGVHNLGVGVGAYVPFGGSAEWDTNDAFAGDDTYPGAVDGVQRWASISGSIRSLYLTAAGAYRIPGLNLSFGAGVNVVLNSVDTVRARNASGTDDLLASTGNIQEGRSIIDASNVNVSFGVGAIWQPSDKLMVGVSYQSRPNYGKNNLKGDLRTKLGIASTSNDKIEIRWPLPDVARAGLRIMPSKRTELRLFGEFVRWSVVDNHCIMTADTASKGCQLTATGAGTPDGATILTNIPRHWKDTFGLRAGGSYWLNKATELFAGLGYDGNAVPDSTAAADIIDMPKISLAGGARFDLTDSLRLSGTYTQVVYFQRDVPLRSGPPLASASRVPDGAGTYKQSVGVLIVGAEYMF